MADSISNSYFRLNDSIIRQTERLNSNQEKKSSKSSSSGTNEFNTILKQEVEKKVTLTKHAALRSEQRNIDVSEADLEKLSDACDQAQEKGINNALIMMKDSAFIVSAQNRRIITVMDKNDMKEKIVNDIDGALFI